MVVWGREIKKKPSEFTADETLLTAAIPGADAHTTVLLARNGDHSLRFNSSSAAADKDLASTSEETASMNRAVATELAAFFATLA